MILLPDPNALRRAERDLRDTAERAPRLEEARTAATPPIHDLPPPRNVVPLPRPRTREERYGTDLSGPRETLTTGLVSHTEFIDRKGDEA
jgi:hypothetical protein